MPIRSRAEINVCAGKTVCELSPVPRNPTTSPYPTSWLSRMPSIVATSFTRAIPPGVSAMRQSRCNGNSLPRVESNSRIQSPSPARHLMLNTPQQPTPDALSATLDCHQFFPVSAAHSSLRSVVHLKNQNSLKPANQWILSVRRIGDDSFTSHFELKVCHRC